MLLAKYLLPLAVSQTKFEHVRILNIPKFWICQCYTRFNICLNNSWICLKMPDYVWICLKMQEYAGIRVNMPKSAWMTLILDILIFPFALQSPSYFNRWLLIWTSTEDYKHSLKEHETVFFKIQNLFFFSIAAGNISFVFCFRLNTFEDRGVE